MSDPFVELIASLPIEVVALVGAAFTLGVGCTIALSLGWTWRDIVAFLGPSDEVGLPNRLIDEQLAEEEDAAARRDQAILDALDARAGVDSRHRWRG